MVPPIHGPCGKTASRPGRQTRGSQVLKSLLSGGFLAALIGVVALLALSIASPPPISNDPPASPLVDAPNVAVVEPNVDTDVDAAIAAPVSADGGEAPSVEVPNVETTADAIDTSPSDVPETTTLEGSLAFADPGESAAPQIQTGSDDPVISQFQGRAPQVPLTEQEVVVSTAPAAPVPAIEEQAPSEADDVAATVQLQPTEDVVEEVAVEQEGTGDVIAPEAEVSPPESLTTLPQPPVLTEPQAPEAPQDDPIVTAGVATTSTGLPKGASGVRVNRVIGSDPEPTVTDEVESAVDPDAPALVRYAAAFENADNKPTVAIVLLDDPAQSDAATQISQLPFPVTVVIDSATTDASDRMTAYRSAGAEVAFRSTFPEGARPSDVEVTLQSALAELPDVVAFVDEGDTGLQSSRDVSNQTIEVMAEEGRGLVIMPKGLNSALRTASAAGVPAATVYRNLDGEGQDARVIKRFIDQAAFRARQDGGVILMGRIRPQTLTALLEWQSSNRAGQVVMAPLSAMLLSQDN